MFVTLRLESQVIYTSINFFVMKNQLFLFFDK